MIGFVLIGGEHQLLHIVPVAAAMSREGHAPVELFAATPRLARAASDLMRRLDSGAFRVTILRLPGALEALARNSRTGGNLKLLRLLRHAARLRRCAALVTAERTSSLLKRLPGRCPPMIHLRHGAGDRAVGFERRIALFDAVIVAGEKDRRRTIEAGLMPAVRCHACGYIKLSTLPRLRGSAVALFDNGRPTVLYNPHFKPQFSSWQKDGREIIRRIGESGQFNLIFAPHVRQFAAAKAAERAELERLAVPGQVLVDLDSPRSLDMTYTLAADIYLGDVSSQVYEFTAEPRPCVFFDSHGTAWRGSPDYLMWQMGEVVDRVDEVLPALLRAGELHSRYRELQQRMTAEALGDAGPDCAAHAARVIVATALQPGRLMGAVR
jgi:hypothetical protein